MRCGLDAAQISAYISANIDLLRGLLLVAVHHLVDPHLTVGLEPRRRRLPRLPLLDLRQQHRDDFGEVTLSELFEHLPN